MKLFGKKKQENNRVQLSSMTETQLNEFVANAIKNYWLGQGYTIVRHKEVYPKGTYFMQPDGSRVVSDGVIQTKVDDLTSPLAALKSELRKDEVQKRRYTKRNKEFWATKKTSQAEEPKEDTLRVFRQRSAASAISPEDFAKMAREGDVYYIPYTDEKPYGSQQAQYSGRVCNRLKTRCSTLYCVNGTTHKAENILKIECLKK